MTAVVGSAAEDTTPSEREAPQRFAWWHPRSADLGRRAEARRQHARRNDLWARPAAGEAPIIPRPLPPPSTWALCSRVRSYLRETPLSLSVCATGCTSGRALPPPDTSVTV